MVDDANQSPEMVENSGAGMHPALAVAAGGAFALNLGILLSLPPVIRGRGAPYLPTFQKKMDSMFCQLRKVPHFSVRASRGERLRIVDLGSGDGRVVFRAAREGYVGVGYEINPLLHLWAATRRCIQAPLYWSSTSFALRDLWKVDLASFDVVVVYGLNPMMIDLGKKLKTELKPGSVVVSEVFEIPGWKPSALSQQEVYLYNVPSCWASSKATPHTDHLSKATN